MVATTLAQLEAWYQEPATEPEKPKLLSKLAVLELCGWLEIEQDRIILGIEGVCLRDNAWVQQQLIEKTFGFDYKKHFRPMLSKILGEHVTRKLEYNMDARFPGDLDQLKSSTGDLWTKRCKFAHADLINHVRAQQRFDAPSWSRSKHQILSQILSRLENEALALARTL